jgi:hypothetical protein
MQGFVRKRHRGASFFRSGSTEGVQTFSIPCLDGQRTSARESLETHSRDSSRQVSRKLELISRLSREELEIALPNLEIVARLKTLFAT